MDALGHPESLQLSVGRVDLVRGLVHRDDELVRLTGRETALLRYLAARPGQVVSREALLLEVWGYAENVVSRAVDKTVNRLRGRIERDRAHPEHLVTEYGIGFRLLPASEDTLPQTPPQPQTEGLAGRDAELAELQQALSRERLITVVGAGGMGKTRLVRHALPGAPLLRADALTESELLAGLRAHQAAPVVVVDSAEHQPEALTVALDGWLQASSGTLVLTSRRPLLVRGEWSLRLGPLDVQASRQILLQQAGRQRSGWGQGHDAAVEQICEAACGWPLALEHLALRARLLGPRDLVAQLGEGLPLDLPGPRDGATRHQTLGASLAHTWDRLPQDTQAFAVRLAVFEGPITLETLRVVLQAPASLVHLERLSDWGLVAVHDQTQEVRVALFEPWRRHLALLLGAPEMAELSRALRQRHMARFTALAAAQGEETEPFSKLDGPDRVSSTQLERADLDKALEWALQVRDADAVRVCGESLVQLHNHVRDLAALRELVERLLDAPVPLPLELTLELRLWRSYLSAIDGGVESALEQTRAVLSEARAAKLVEAEAAAHLGLAMIHYLGELGDPIPHLEAALRCAQEGGTFTGHYHLELAWRHMDLAQEPGRLERAVHHFAEARRAALRVGNSKLEVGVLRGQAFLALHRGDVDQARALGERAIPLLVQLGNSTTSSLELCGRVALASNDAERAVQHLKRALRGRVREGQRVARTLGYLASAHLAGGEMQQARARIEQAERLARKQRGKLDLTQILYQRGCIDLADGDRPAALRAQQEADALQAQLASGYRELKRVLELKEALEQALA